MKPNKYKNIAGSVDDHSDSDVDPNNGQPAQENDDPNAPYDYLGGFIIPVGTMLLFYCVGAMFVLGIYCIPYALGWTDHLPWENPYACETTKEEIEECRTAVAQPDGQATKHKS